MSAQVAGQVGVRRGDPIAATEAEHWLRDYAKSQDAALREWIILAYLGLADRIASPYRHGHRTTLEDLTQTARAGLIAAVDRYDPAKSPSFVPFAVACVVGELNGICGTPAGACTCPAGQRSRAAAVQGGR